MKTIDETNYRTELRKLNHVLPDGSIQMIADKTGETYPTVCNVLYGRQYKQNVIDAFVKEYNEYIKTLKPVKVA